MCVCLNFDFLFFLWNWENEQRSPLIRQQRLYMTRAGLVQVEKPRRGWIRGFNYHTLTGVCVRMLTRILLVYTVAVAEGRFASAGGKSSDFGSWPPLLRTQQNVVVGRINIDSKNCSLFVRNLFVSAFAWNISYCRRR
ncbi:hypothetical protein ACP275_13G087100 [Erythranthe tilingii]